MKYELSSLILTILEIESKNFKYTNWEKLKLPIGQNNFTSDFFKKIKMEVYKHIIDEKEREIYFDKRKNEILVDKDIVRDINDLFLKYVHFDFNVFGFVEDQNFNKNFNKNLFQLFMKDIEILIGLNSLIDKKIRII